MQVVWAGRGESPNCSLNLKKNRPVLNQIKTISCIEKEATDRKEKNTELVKF